MTITRRRFVQGSLAATTGGLMLAPGARVRGANDQIRVGIVGLGNRGGIAGWGGGHVKWFHGLSGVRVTGLCDPDRKRLEKSRKWLADRGEKPATWTDLRGMMEDKSIDVVVVATCNHWHVLAGIWAMEAGKDVYCEKPISHNIWEGRQLVAAARKYDRICQGGTQQRSDPLQDKVKKFIHEDGRLGRIKHVRLNRYGRRGPIGRRENPMSPPEHVDYNLWLGPAADEPITRQRFQYDWHWVWNTGNGEAGNWGPHIIDDCRNVAFLDEIGLPKRAVSGGGRVAWDDAGDTPNTQFVYFDTGGVPVILDIHNLPRKKGMKARDVYEHRRTSAFLVVECEDGYYAGGRGGGTAYDNDGNRIEKFSGNGGRDHAANFIEAVRNRDRGILNAEIETTHYSTAWCLLANLSYRLGGSYSREEAMSAVAGSTPWQRVVDGLHEHLEANEIDPDQAGLKLGPMLEIDTERERLTGPTATDEAEALWNGQQRGYRKPFVVPEIEKA